MEPGHNGPSANHERAPSLPSVPPEYFPGAQPEVVPEQSPERAPAPQHEQGPQPAPPTNDDAALAPIVDAPVAMPPVDDSQVVDDTATLLATLPDVAGDDDQIEKEWVDKTKQIINETAHDPHKREVAINALRREYLRKRYGKEVSTAD